MNSMKQEHVGWRVNDMYTAGWGQTQLPAVRQTRKGKTTAWWRSGSCPRCSRSASPNRYATCGDSIRKPLATNRLMANCCLGGLWKWKGVGWGGVGGLCTRTATHLQIHQAHTYCTRTGSRVVFHRAEYYSPTRLFVHLKNNEIIWNLTYLLDFRLWQVSALKIWTLWSWYSNTTTVPAELICIWCLQVKIKRQVSLLYDPLIQKTTACLPSAGWGGL